MEKVRVIMVAHNQIDLVKQGLEILKMYSQIDDEDVIVVDNASEDGLSDWLDVSRKDCLISEHQMMGFAAIINAAIHEFKIDSDILVMTPSYIMLPNAIKEMQKVLYSETMVGAVSPSVIGSGSEHGKDYMSAVDYVNFLANDPTSRVRDKWQMGLNAGAIMIKGSMLKCLGAFDERLLSPKNTVTDYLFRGILNEFKFLECGNAYLYSVGNDWVAWSDSVNTEVDRSVLKEKWHMNYFNTNANWNLIELMNHQVNDQFHVLEIGCDCGANLYGGVKNCFPNAQLFGVEINPYAAEIASHLFDVRVGNIEEKNLDFGDIRFDYIMFGDVLEHLHDPAGAICYCKRWLKKDGRILASIPNLMHYSVMKELINGNFSYSDCGLLDKTHIHFFTYNEMVKMFLSEGYEIETVNALSPSVSSEPDTDFIRKLVELSDGAEEFMFRTFQYLIVAKRP